LTNADVEAYVRNNWSGKDKTWDALDFNGKQFHLMSAETRVTLATEMATKVSEQFQGRLQYLPEVNCPQEAECRKRTFQKYIPELTTLWKTMLDEIDNKLVTSRATIEIHLEKKYEEAYECEPGCHCDNIHLEYDQVIMWQKDLQGLIEEEERQLTILIDKEANIITNCPDYADRAGEYGD
jgi:hypothetical protein